MSGRRVWSGVLLFKKRDKRVCSNDRVITLLSLPGKDYSTVLERGVGLLVKSVLREAS